MMYCWQFYTIALESSHFYYVPLYTTVVGDESKENCFDTNGKKSKQKGELSKRSSLI